jgi:nicotinamide mononucleotide adenylyltransferase
MPMQLCVSLKGWDDQFGPQAADHKPTALTIGNFDGLHLGHQQILERLIERARAINAIATVVTFDPHPMKVLHPDSAPKLIFPLEQRLLGIEQMGVDAALVLPFDLELSRLSPEDFVRQILVEKLRAKVILVGGNFRFGHKQAGDVKLLIDMGTKFGFDVDVISPVLMRKQIVSSTAIREFISSGETSRATHRPPLCPHWRCPARHRHWQAAGRAHAQSRARPGTPSAHGRLRHRDVDRAQPRRRHRHWTSPPPRRPAQPRLSLRHQHRRAPHIRRHQAHHRIPLARFFRQPYHRLAGH